MHVGEVEFMRNNISDGSGNNLRVTRKTDVLYSQPKRAGLSNFKDLIDGKGPDPLYAGQAFRNYVGNPIAAELAGAREADKLPEVVIDQPDFLPSVFLRVGSERARAVCRILVSGGVDYSGENRPDGWKGTGFLVGTGLLLTNHHVVNSKKVARDCVCQFNYLIGSNGTVEGYKEFKLLPDELFVTSPYEGGLDYTFVSIEPGAAEEFGTVALEKAAYVAHPGTFANVIQHPNGRPQEIVIQDNRVVSDNGTLLHYLSDTDYGSSGSPVFDNTWKLIALHHARIRNHNGLRIGAGEPPRYLNEGVKISTLATDVEQRAQKEGLGNPSATVLKYFNGINSISGFFGTLGRRGSVDNQSARELVVDLYKGTDNDIDFGFWNTQWLDGRVQEKVEEVATVIADFNLDVWALTDSSPTASKQLVEILWRKFKLEFDVAHSEPDVGVGKQSTGVLWNTRTVTGERLEWPAEITDWFEIDSRDFEDNLLETTHGRVFNRYPSLFQFQSLAGTKCFDFFLVPLQLEAMRQGSLRLGMATKILAAAINRMIEDGASQDWMIGGNYNAAVASEDFDPLSRKDFIAVSAEDEGNGAITYIRGQYASLTDHIYLSPNFARQYGPQDLYSVAADRSIPEYVERISDHRPVLARISIASTESAGITGRSRQQKTLPDSLTRELDSMYATSPGVAKEPVSNATKRKAANAVRQAVNKMQEPPSYRRKKK